MTFETVTAILLFSTPQQSGGFILSVLFFFKIGYATDHLMLSSIALTFASVLFFDILVTMHYFERLWWDFNKPKRNGDHSEFTSSDCLENIWKVHQITRNLWTGPKL